MGSPTDDGRDVMLLSWAVEEAHDTGEGCSEWLAQALLERGLVTFDEDGAGTSTPKAKALRHKALMVEASPPVGGELSIEDCDKAVEALGVIRSRLDTNATDAVSRFVWKARAALFGSGGAGDLATPETLRGGEFLSGLAEQGFRELAEGDVDPGEPATPPLPSTDGLFGNKDVPATPEPLWEPAPIERETTSVRGRVVKTVERVLPMDGATEPDPALPEDPPPHYVVDVDEFAAQGYGFNPRAVFPPQRAPGMQGAVDATHAHQRAVLASAPSPQVGEAFWDAVRSHVLACGGQVPDAGPGKGWDTLLAIRDAIGGPSAPKGVEPRLDELADRVQDLERELGCGCCNTATPPCGCCPCPRHADDPIEFGSTSAIASEVSHCIICGGIGRIPVCPECGTREGGAAPPDEATADEKALELARTLVTTSGIHEDYQLVASELLRISGASAREPRGLHVMADDGSVLVDLDVGAREPQWTKDALFAAQRRVVELDAELSAMGAREPQDVRSPGEHDGPRESSGFAFNLNSYVRWTPNDRGALLWNKSRYPGSPDIAVADEERKDQLWEFANVIGPALRMGAPPPCKFLVRMEQGCGEVEPTPLPEGVRWESPHPSTGITAYAVFTTPKGLEGRVWVDEDGLNFAGQVDYVPLSVARAVLSRTTGGDR